jgi:hypothetical protein
MKKILLSIFAISLIMNSLQAQDDRAVRLAFAVQPSVAWLSPKDNLIESDGSRIGFAYGILTDLMIAGNPNYAFATGIMVNGQGGTISNDFYHDGVTESIAGSDSLIDAFASSTEKYKLQYIEVPLTLKLKTNEIGYLTYYGQFGLNLGFNISARQDIEYQFEGLEPSAEEDINIGGQINPIRAALQIGGGVEYNISGNTHILAGLVWNNGLTNVFDQDFIKQDEDGSPTLSEDGNTKVSRGDKVSAVSNYFGLTVGVFF